MIGSALTEKGRAMSDDSINRRAAINALNSLQKFCLIDSNEYQHVVGVRLKYAIQKLEQLPSAQPEIIRCKDCVHCEPWYGDKGLCLFWSETGVGVFLNGFCNYGERKTQ